MNAGRARRFLLVDPCLTGLGSHPYHYAELVLAAAERAGCECLMVTHRECRAATGRWPTIPAFTHTAYSKYNLYGGLDRLDRRGRPSVLSDLPWTARHARLRREERVATFARELLPALEGLAAGDVVLVATASELEAAGLSRAVAAARPPAGVGWHVLFHFPILRGFPADFARQEPRLAEARALLRAATAAAGHVVHHHATTEELAAQYARLVPGAVDVLPYPVQAPPRGPRHAGPLRVACLGDARPEKHSGCLAAVVATVAADPELAGRVRFAVQTNPGYPRASRRREHVAVTRCLAALSRAAEAGAPVELLAGPLDAGAYARELAAADIVLLPYDQDRYRSRCSGIVLEALVTGAVPILTGGGWMARQIAPAVAAHTADLMARAKVLATRRIAAPRLGRRSLAIDVPAPAAGAGQPALAVEVAWAGSPEERLQAPPVRVAVAGAARPPTVLAADGDGVATAVFPLEAAAGPVLVAPACGAPAAAPAAITVRALAVAGPVPASAVGLVIDAPADVPEAIREVARHVAHYRATAAAGAEAVRRSASADEIVRRLLG